MKNFSQTVRGFHLPVAAYRTIIEQVLLPFKIYGKQGVLDAEKGSSRGMNCTHSGTNGDALIDTFPHKATPTPYIKYNPAI